MDGLPGLVALVVVSLATLAIGTYGLRVSRTTSDFYVASRSVRPGLNASAIGGEYLSAASFLGVAALVLAAGAQMLWYPVGWTAGYLVLLVLVAAPLRRSGAYTLPDFAEARLGSRRVRALCSVLVVAIGWLYLLPQFQGAGLTLTAAIDAPKWVGAVVVGVVVVVNVSSGGMRSITFVQAFQYWLKLTALLVPAAVLLVVWDGDGRPDAGGGGAGWSMPLGEGNQGLYTTYSIVLATFLGTMGLPHVVVRFYTNPDGRAARRTTLVVLALLGVFYLLPPIYAALGRAYGADADDTVVLELPRLMLDGPRRRPADRAGHCRRVRGVPVDLVRPRDRGLRRARAGRARWPRCRASRRSGVAATFAVGVPLAAAVLAPDLSVARAVGLAFAVAASTFCPLLVLGIWWRGLTPAGAVAGLLAGGLGAGAGVAWTLYDGAPGELARRAARTAGRLERAAGVRRRWSASRCSPATAVPGHASRFMVRLHTPEVVQLDRG